MRITNYGDCHSIQYRCSVSRFFSSPTLLFYKFINIWLMTYTAKFERNCHRLKSTHAHSGMLLTLLYKYNTVERSNSWSSGFFSLIEQQWKRFVVVVVFLSVLYCNAHVHTRMLIIHRRQQQSDRGMFYGRMRKEQNEMKTNRRVCDLNAWTAKMFTYFFTGFL